jgi:organic hydroperoxide reductase OsmC/OhrA
MLHMPTHTFEGTLAWRAGAEGVAAANHRVVFAGRPPLELSAAPQYRGDPSWELLIASIASCQFLTYLALARRAGVSVLAYEDRPSGTLAIADRKMRITEVLLRPRITLAAGADEARGRALVEEAHAGCFVANSVSCAVRIEPTVVRGG